MSDLEKELDEIIAREKPGYKRVQIAGMGTTADDRVPSDTTSDLIQKYLGGGTKSASPRGTEGGESDVAIVHVRPERESDDPRQNVPKAVVISRSLKKIVGEQG